VSHGHLREAIHQFSCDQCESSVTAGNGDEPIRVARDDAETTHGMSVSADDVRSGWSEAGAADA
jgi:hypothetical protein